MRISLPDIRLHFAQFRRRKCGGSAGPAQRPIVIGRQGNARHIAARDQIHECIIRRIKQHVERNVAEVPYVTDPIAAAEAGFTVAENIPGEADARGEILLARRPQLADRAIWRKFDLALRDRLIRIGNVGRIKVRIQRRIHVVLHSVIFPAQAIIQGHTARDLPGILRIERAFVIAVAAVKRRRAEWKRHGAGRRRHAVHTRIFPLRRNGALKRIGLPGQKIVNALANGRGRQYLLVACFERAEGLVTRADTSMDPPQKPELVFPLGPTWNSDTPRQSSQDPHPGSKSRDRKGHVSLEESRHSKPRKSDAPPFTKV